MHNHDHKYPSRPGFEHGTPGLQAPVDTNEPSRIMYNIHCTTRHRHRQRQTSSVAELTSDPLYIIKI